MPKIIRFHETGGADVLQIEDLPFEQPGLEEAANLANHAAVRTTRIYDKRDRAVRRTSVERIVY